MPIVTEPPVQLSANPPNTSQGITERRKFINFEIGAAQYIVLTDDGLLAPFEYPIMVFKSTDNGLTFTLMDNAGTPANGTYSGNIFAVVNGPLIKIIYVDPDAGLGRRVTYVEFDTATDTYGAPDFGPATDPVFAHHIYWQAAQLPNGDFLFVDDLQAGGSAGGLMSVRRVAGVWGLVVVLRARVPGNVSQPFGLVMNGAIGCFAENADIGAATGLLYSTISALDVLSAPQVITDGSSGLISESGPMVIWNNRLVLSMVSFSRPFLWEGSPVAAPVWTSKFFGSDGANARESMFLPVDATNGEVWWTGAASPGLLTQLRYQPYDGSAAGSEVAFYDATVAPPPGTGDVAPADQYVAQPSVLALANGNRAIVLGIVYDEPDEDSSMFYMAGLFISCNNPPVGIVRTEYFHEIPAESGTPAFSYEIIAGTLPDGLILDVNTGEISGDPLVNGIFPFTIRATDSTDVTGAVACSITIQKRCLLVQNE